MGDLQKEEKKKIPRLDIKSGHRVVISTIYNVNVENALFITLYYTIHHQRNSSRDI